MANRFSDMALNMGVGKDTTASAPKEAASAGASEIPQTSHQAETASERLESPASRARVPPQTKTGEKPPMTRKTTAMPVVLDWAIKELKERRNLSRQIKGEKRKLTEDDIVVEALEYFFSTEKAAADCYKTVTAKMQSVL